MRPRALAAIALLAGTLALTACSSSSTDTSTQPSTGASSTPSATAPDSSTPATQSTAPEATSGQTGTFSGLNGKKVSGTVSVSADSIVLSGFSSDEGPDLHIYLTDGTDESAVTAGKEISTVAFDKAAQTFSLDGVDISQYSDVVIHCDKAKAVFGAATLS
jgi:ABC-type oligopeptide transport system substrate-binding subunit